MAHTKSHCLKQRTYNLLGIKNIRTTTREFDEYEKGVDTIYTLGGKQEITFLKEPGLYKVIIRSTKMKMGV